MTPTRSATATRRARRVFRRWATRTAPCAPYARYWAGAGAVWPLADGLHTWLGAVETLPWASAGLTLAGIGLTGWACHTAKTRDTLTRVLAPATAGLAGVWCTAATITSPAGSPAWQLWAIGAPGLALAWSLTHARRHPAGQDYQPGQLTSGTADMPALSATPTRPTAPVAPGVSTAGGDQPCPDTSAAATLEEGRIVSVTTTFQEPTETAAPTEPTEPAEWAMSGQQAAAVGADDAGDGWVPLGEEMPMDLSDLSDPVDDLDAMLGLPDDPEPDLPGDATSALPEDPEVADTLLAPSRPTRSEARVRLRKLLGRMAAHGRYEFSIRDLPEPAQLFGRGRSWLSGELSRLVDTGLLETGGQAGNATVYRIRARQDRDAA